MSETPVRVAIVGVGNCASSFVQGLEYYRWVGDEWTSGWAEHLKSKREEVSGLLHTTIGGFYPKDPRIMSPGSLIENGPTSISRGTVSEICLSRLRQSWKYGIVRTGPQLC